MAEDLTPERFAEQEAHPEQAKPAFTAEQFAAILNKAGHRKPQGVSDPQHASDHGAPNSVGGKTATKGDLPPH
ncbi:MAG: hypothetical protein U1E36_05820 [Rickettsiales bacterium]